MFIQSGHAIVEWIGGLAAAACDQKQNSRPTKSGEKFWGNTT
jgi:hypothetical protein